MRMGCCAGRPIPLRYSPMTWFGWLLATFLIFGALVTVADVGKPRKPLTSTVAACTVVVTGLFVWGMATVGTVR